MNSLGTVKWPELQVGAWTPTRETLHMWLQIVGKVRLAHAPLVNHWWQVTFYVTPRGLTTSAIPYATGLFDIEFDFVRHHLVIRSSDGRERSIALRPMPVAEFYGEFMNFLDDLGLATRIQGRPNEVEPALAFADDFQHRDYDPEAVTLFWRQLLAAHQGLTDFRARFVGKVSPVHLFWGAMDLACTRFSGRGAPAHPGGAPNCGDWVMVEGYSRELWSCGFWPGGGEEGAFYAYAYPEPDAFPECSPGVEGGYYNVDHRQFLLPYEAVRVSDEPDRTLATFLDRTYGAAADTGAWDRGELEIDPARWAAERQVTPHAEH